MAIVGTFYVVEPGADAVVVRDKAITRVEAQVTRKGEIPSTTVTYTDGIDRLTRTAPCLSFKAYKDMVEKAQAKGDANIVVDLRPIQENTCSKLRAFRTPDPS